jgi:hypothetical protein
MKKILVILSLFLIQAFSFGQLETEPIEIFLIDAYATPELPHTFVLSFFTSEPAITRVLLEKSYEYQVSTRLSEMHSISIDLTHLEFESKTVKFIIESLDSSGNISINEEYDFDLPYEPEIKSGSSLFTFCLFGGMIFALPAPGYLFNTSNGNFSLTKEIPVFSFRSGSFHYPASYLSFEYTYVFNKESRNFIRIGYKRLFEVDFIRCISPGVSAYSDLSGQNGFSPEISFGLFTIFNSTFTVYTRYRFNYKPGGIADENFHEANLGLYSSFFSFYLK